MNVTAFEFFFWVCPMMTVAFTVASWAVSMLINSPRPYRRDPLNLSVIGTFLILAFYLISRVLIVLDLLSRDVIRPLYLIAAAGFLSAIALPRTIAELARAIRSLRNREALP